MLTSPPTGSGAAEVTDGPGMRGGMPLRERLRTETRTAHLAAEAAFDLAAHLGSPRRYAQALLVSEAFHRACEPSLLPVADELPAALLAGPPLRHARLLADLRALGREPDPDLCAAPPPRAGRDAALGTWYVLEGAALGGLVIAAEVRRRLPAVAHATRYFAGEGRATARRWRAFTAVLDRSEHDGDAVVAGALATFAAFIDLWGPRA